MTQKRKSIGAAAARAGARKSLASRGAPSTPIAEVPSAPREDKYPPEDYEPRVFYCGVEGGLSCTRIAVIEKNPTEKFNKGKRYYNTIQGIDCFYSSPEAMTATIVDGITQLMAEITGEPNTWQQWARIEKIVVVFPEPVRDAKMDGLERMFREKYALKTAPNRIADEFHVMTEVEMVVRTHFRHSEHGIAVQCGVDTACFYNGTHGKMKQHDVTPSVSGDGGAYWIARTVHTLIVESFQKHSMRVFQPSRYYATKDKQKGHPIIPDFTKIVDIIANKFQIPPKTVCESTEMFYSHWFKHRYAQLCEVFANVAVENDTLSKVFDWAGETVGNLVAATIKEWHMRALKQMAPEKVTPLPIVLYGRTFDSFHLMEGGFLDSLAKSGIPQVTLYRKRENSAAAAAVLAARLAFRTDAEKAVYEIDDPEFIEEVTFQKMPHVYYPEWESSREKSPEQPKNSETPESPATPETPDCA
ncbi:hypothetical protein GCK72_004503 [Caenorhabditis remanei]|uniref:Phosphotransferase n=1 Tax=Caenorhabditis remanei TaxID=31234 RepID=A0A6A5HCH9_CAERE|nr:hypothetical protein GCK72_004503 [Caenorhabditis remanei]KAF1764554.1 hypothetical protein GCK72_004503 [Caenorhabditis remanei]